MEDTIKLILENWQIVFVYGLKILGDIKKSLNSHETRITECELRNQIKKEYGIT